MAQINRLEFLDSLRGFIILLVVVLHASAVYMKMPPQWWYVVDPQKSLFFTFVSILLSVPLMAPMFFIAGYFALKSLQKNGVHHYLKNKLIRIGAPWAFGALILAPMAGYFIHFSRGNPMEFFHFVLYEHWVNSYQQSVYWFLGILLLFFLCLTLTFKFSVSLRQAKPQTKKPTPIFFIGFLATCITSMLVVNQYVSLTSWYTDLYIIMFQPVKLPLYAAYFCLGIYAYLNNWYPLKTETLKLQYHFIFWVMTASLYALYSIKLLPIPAGNELVSKAAKIIFFNLYCFSSLMFGVALFQKKVNTKSSFWQAISKTSYGIYFIHIIVLCPVTYLLLYTTMPLAIKASLAIGLTGLISWTITHFILNKAPYSRLAFAP
ncbi:MAG: acyltransferase family protein [Agarilytica sp.]